MEWFIAVVVIAVLGAAAIVAAGGLGSMSAEPTRDVYRQDLPTDRVLTGEDLRRLRFAVTLRGYAMGQVDEVLDRLSGELAERDRRILDLEERLAQSGLAQSGLAQSGLGQSGLGQSGLGQNGPGPSGASAAVEQRVGVIGASGVEPQP